MATKRIKMSNQPVPKKQIKERERRKKPVQSFKIYMYTVLKQVHPTVAISGRAMDIMNSCILDIFERLTGEAFRLMIHSKKRTLTSWDIECAVKLLLPGELAKHAISEGNKAVRKYNQSMLNENK